MEAATMSHVSSDIVKRVASAPVLLVAADFDGTLAPLVDHPALARIQPAAAEALGRLARVRQTHVAVISGRGLDDLRLRVGSHASWELSGSHGAELSDDRPRDLSSESRSQCASIAEHLTRLAESHPGCFVEVKPRGVAFHYRGLRDADAKDVVSAVTSLLPSVPALKLRLGSKVVEFVADAVTKADGLRRIMFRTGACAALFIGDDLTDEHVFRVLGPLDAGVKVGAGESAAEFRVQDPEAVAQLLTHLAQEREAWAAGQSIVAINAHSLLSDQRTCALVDPSGRVSWMCVPRFDSPPIFAELLGGPSAGFFDVRPAHDSSDAAQRYLPRSLVLETRWQGLTVTDYLDCGWGRAFQRAGRTDFVRVIEAGVPCRIRFAPRCDFGRSPTRLSLREHGLEILGSADPMLLYAPGIRWSVLDDGPHHTAVAELEPSPVPVVLELRIGTSSDRAHPQAEPPRREATQRFWSTWADSLRLPRVASEAVLRSAIILRALVYGPTGALAAAATTSLPEHLGGQRNWDYRYCWPRDAAMAARALVRLGNTGTAMRLLDWLIPVLERCESPGRLRPVYSVDGRDLGSEAEISALPGYGNSRPVRVGNAASQQVQLDVFGPITDLIASLAERGAPISPDHWRLTRAMVEAVEARWQEPDHGIWEIRGERAHHVHSKAACFQTVDRAVSIHECVVGRSNPAWESLRQAIRDDVIRHGWNADARAFTGTYGGRHLDAAALAVGLSGLLEISDPRVVSTIEAIEKGLCSGSTVYRYRIDDGLPGREGGFHLCTGWLIEALALTGRVADATHLFGRLLSSMGPTGVMSEQFDPEHGIHLGNVPQAYSHLAVINAAATLDHVGVSADAVLPRPARPSPGESA
jgi:trehalose-phosphatase